MYVVYGIDKFALEQDCYGQYFLSRHGSLVCFYILFIKKNLLTSFGMEVLVLLNSTQHIHTHGYTLDKFQ